MTYHSTMNKSNNNSEKEFIDFDKARELANAYSDKILTDLGLETDSYGDVKCACPIHGGDNYRAFSWDDRRKTWLCFTHKCHESHTKTILGLIRGIKKCNWQEVIEYIEEITGEKVGTITQEQVDLHNFIRKNKVRKTTDLTILDSSLLQKIQPKSDYFSSRGISDEAIQKWKMFECRKDKNTLFNRACLPIINHNKQLLGFAGRSITGMEPKWLTSPLNNDFKTTLFGINHAIESIKAEGKVILVEGFLDVVHMHECGYTNCVSIFGTDLSEKQRNLLIELNVRDIVLMLDPDLAGLKASESIEKKLSCFFNVTNVTQSLTKDPADLSVEEIKNIFLRIS